MLCPLASIIHSNLIDILLCFVTRSLAFVKHEINSVFLVSWPKQVQYFAVFSLQPTSVTRSISISSSYLREGVPSFSSNQNFVFVCFPLACHMSKLVNRLVTEQFRWGTQIVKCLFMQFLPLHIYFICVTLNCFLQLFLLTHLQYVFYIF